MNATGALKSALARDRLVVLAALIAATALAWLYLIDMARGMAAMPGGSGMMAIQTWDQAYFVAMFFMWAIMMVGMMVPSATPMVLLYAAFIRTRHNAAPYRSTAAFLAGYLLAWTAFSLVATTLQWALSEAALLSPMMVSTSPYFGAALLIAAGVFQLTPWKNACLAHCRSPMDFVMRHWRSGRFGALRMGLHHGLYCLGCCWLLMVLLFVGGVMNLLWIAAITVFVLIEKVAPFPHAARYVSAAGLIAVGVGVLATG